MKLLTNEQQKKELVEEFEKQLTCLGENTIKYIIKFQQKKKLQEFIKMKKKLEKQYLTYYNLLIVQNVSQAHQILSIIFLKEFLKLNINTDLMMENKYCNCFLEYKF